MHEPQTMHRGMSMHHARTHGIARAAAKIVPTSRAAGHSLPDRLFKTFAHVVEPVKSPYNAGVKRNSGEPAVTPRDTADP